MNTAGKKDHDVELPLSPVLNKKRLSRRVANRKSCSRSNDQLISPRSTQTKSPHKPTSSHIPVPVLKCKDASLSPQLQPEVHTGSSSSLTNFKERVITNCARLNALSPKKDTSNQGSISEGTIKTSKAYLTGNKTESDSKVVQHFKKVYGHQKFRGSHKPCHKNETKCGSGDLPHHSSNRSQPRQMCKVPKTNLDMLYENKKFAGSKSTLDSDGSPSPSPSSMESMSSPRKSPRCLKRKSCETPQCIREEDNDRDQYSQPNQNCTIDEYGMFGGNTGDRAAHAEERRNVHDREFSYTSRPCKNKVKSSFLTKNVIESANAHEVHTSERTTTKNPVTVALSPRLQQEIRNWTDSMDAEEARINHVHDRCSNLRNSHDAGGEVCQNGEPLFLGFTTEEVEFIAEKYNHYKNYLRTLGFKRKKVRQSSNTSQGRSDCTNFRKNRRETMADAQTSPKTTSDNALNGVEVEPQDESLAVTANNRVQICIGNNRIQINIKSDKKSECGTSEKNDSQGMNRAIDVSSGSNNKKCNGNEFWSINTIGSKDGNIKTLLKSSNELEAPKHCINHNNVDHSTRGKTDLSSSGFKSASGRDITISKESLQRAEELFDDGNGVKKLAQPSIFSDGGGFKSASGKPIMLNVGALQKASKLFDNLDDNANSSSASAIISRESTTATESIVLTSPSSTEVTKISSNQSVRGQAATVGAIPVHERKILKAKSLLGKSNFRKSLLGDFENGDNIVEFGKVQPFNFEFKSDFTNNAGKKIALAPEKLQQSLDADVPRLHNGGFVGFRSASGKKLHVDAEKLQKAAAKFQDLETEMPPNEHEHKTTARFSGFSSALGKKLHVESTKLQTASAIFHDLDTDVPSHEKHGNGVGFSGFSSAPGKRVHVDSKNRQATSIMFQNLDEEIVSNEKYETSSGYDCFAGIVEKKVHMVSEKIPVPAAAFQNLDKNFESACANNYNFDGFSSASGVKIDVDIEKLKCAARKFQDLGVSEVSNLSTSSCTKTAHELIEDVVQTYDKALKHLNTPNFENDNIQNKSIFTSKNQDSTLQEKDLTPIKSSVTMAKKRLGMPRVNKFNLIPKEKLEKARLLFDQNENDLTITPMKSFCKVPRNCPSATSPAASASTFNPHIYSVNTPVRSGTLTTSTPQPHRGNGRLNDISNITVDVTPIKSVEGCKNQKRRSEQSYIHDSDEDYDGILLFREKSCSNLQKLQNDIELEYMHLKKKLEILEERKKALEFQRAAIDQCDPEHTRPRLGILSIHKKNAAKRFKLSELPVILPDSSHCYNIDLRMQEITARNADRLHFNATRNDKPVVHTLDGGKVIPNTRNTIGVTEINNAFQAMSGIDPKLIPKGWVANHYKWIVWKLASYERRYPECFKNCLTVDCIMQQLKYRYDREIDKASRPAIRRIMEKDDVPNKRMVLCVADIIQICSNKYELLLTDGWYSIRTVIDHLLCGQIDTHKIFVGMKLMIQAAELLNCDDGCHPLESTDHVKLKICYNNTRRAKWHLRLGYYHIPTHFPIFLRCIQPEGGQVACVKVYIVRIYPLRYIEEINGIKTWRNSKAEEKRANEFENERMLTFDNIKSQVYDEYEASLKVIPNRIKSLNHISSITCPKLLNQLLEDSNDPEGLYNMLSLSQKNLIMEHKLNATTERQREISERVRQRIEELKLAKRYITPMLKILVTDALEDNAKCTVLNVWKPNEEQLQMFEEGTCVSIYNVQVKKSHELNTVQRTMFRLHEGVLNKRCQRHLLPISMTTDAFYKPLFNEFDTVGVVVDITVKEHDQDVWLTDYVGNLLYIKIIDGPKLCSLLDGVNIGETVALCNLLIQLPHSQFGQSIANQYSSLSKNPQLSFLKQGMEIFNSQLPDIRRLVQDCKTKIESLSAHVNLKANQSYHDYALLHKSNVHLFDDALDENATLPSRLTMMDVAMSLIDTDKLN